MTTADRIKLLRESLGLTQEQLASRMGYTGKSSISKIESSGDNVTLKKISKLAPILHTSEAYLMGWTDNPDPNYQYSNEFVEELATNANRNMRNMVMKAFNPVNNSSEESTTDNPDDAFYESLTDEQKAEITRLYQKYQNASPEVRSAVELLLKAQSQES